MENNCFFKKGDSVAVLGNSKIEIRLDCHNGAITGIQNITSGINYLGKGTPEVFKLQHCTWSNHGAFPKDLWSAVTGTLVCSSKQNVASMHFEKSEGGARLEVAYDELHLEHRTIPVGIKYTIELAANDEETKWKIAIQNRDAGTIREVHFPYISGLNSFDNLIMPNQGGQKLVDPVNKLSDEAPNIYLEYPARASMQWFEYYSPQAGLYMASYDKALGYTRLYFGRPEGKTDAAMWIVKYPFAVSETTWESPTLAVGVHAGDWHWGADRYRAWTESWMEKPHVSQHVLEMFGGIAEIIIKDHQEQVLNRYEDLAQIVSDNRQQPDAVSYLMAGWLYNGHDTYYPEYKPIEDLGGKKALVDAVDKVHVMGASINAYVNARLASIETETYQKKGKKWAVMIKAPGLGANQIEFAELHENWNTAWERDKRGEGWFAVMCPSVNEWQDHLVSTCVRVVKDYHFDGIFLDQPGSYWAELCYNKNHGHSTPATAWGPGYLELFRRIREATKQANPDCFLYTEGMNDAYGQYLDFHMDKNPTWEPMKIHPEMETFVEMWRYTLPSYIIINYPFVYSFPPSQDKVFGENYHFVLGVREQLPQELLDNEVSQGGKEAYGTEEQRIMHRGVVERIRKLWIKGGKYLYSGRFMDDIGLKASSTDLLAKVYSAEDGIAVPVWNTSGEVLDCELTIDLEMLDRVALIDSSAVSVDTDRLLNQTIRGRCITIQLQLQPHDIDVIAIPALDITS